MRSFASLPFSSIWASYTINLRYITTNLQTKNSISGIFYYITFSKISQSIYPILQNTFNKINNTAPGIPNIPTIKAFIIFKPIWNPKDVPIVFITKITRAPKPVLSTTLNIFLIGSKKIFPKMSKKIMQITTEIKILVSIFYLVWLYTQEIPLYNNCVTYFPPLFFRT